VAGAYYGQQAIRESWLEKLALRTEIEAFALKLLEAAGVE